MKLVSLVQKQMVVVGAKVDSYPGAMDVLLSLLDIDTTPLKSALSEREKLLTTVVAPGIAFPHCRNNAVSDFHLLIGVFPDGFAAEGQEEPIRYVAMFLMPEGASNVYLRTVAAMARLLGEEGALSRIAAVKSVDEFIQLVEKSGVMVQDVVTAADIMTETTVSLKPDSTLREAADEMVKNQMPAIPVVDDHGIYKGIVHAERLLKVGLPEYLLSMESVSFLTTFEPFQDLLKEEQSMTVQEIMETDFPAFMSHTPMIVVASKLVREGISSAPVLDREGHLCGMISSLDFVHKVVRV